MNSNQLQWSKPHVPIKHMCTVQVRTSRFIQEKLAGALVHKHIGVQAYIGSKFHWLLAWFLHGSVFHLYLVALVQIYLSLSFSSFCWNLQFPLAWVCLSAFVHTQMLAHQRISCMRLHVSLYILFRFVLRNRWTSAYDSYFIVHNNKIAISKRQIVLPTENQTTREQTENSVVFSLLIIRDVFKNIKTRPTQKGNNFSLLFSSRIKPADRHEYFNIYNFHFN